VIESPVIITDSENEDYFSPTDGDKASENLPGTVTKRFPSDFTANAEDMIDLTTDNSNSSSGVNTPDSTQQPLNMPYPHVKLLDFLSPEVSPKDLAMSIKKQSGTVSPLLSSNVTSSVEEPVSAELADINVVSHYGVTARSPVSSNEAASVRQISPPQDPDELRRAVLLPLDKRVATPVTTPISSSTLMHRSARVSIRKFDSPGSVLTASIAKGTVSVRKDQYQKRMMQSSVDKHMSSVADSSNFDQQYKFSPPVEVSSPDKTSSGEGTSKGTKQQSPNIFPFSPPLTRSQRRKTIEQETMNERSSVKLFTEMTMTSDVNLDPADDVPATYAPKESGKKKARVSTAEVTTTAKTYRTR